MGTKRCIIYILSLLYAFEAFHIKNKKAFISQENLLPKFPFIGIYLCRNASLWRNPVFMSTGSLGLRADGVSFLSLPKLACKSDITH